MKKKLDYQQALHVLEQGQRIECQLGTRKDNTEIVRNIGRLEYLQNLNAEEVQKCIFYSILEEQPKTPDNSIQISFDEAYEMVAQGELVYYQEEGEEEEITTILELIDIRTKKEYQRKQLFLYWHE